MIKQITDYFKPDSKMKYGKIKFSHKDNASAQHSVPYPKKITTNLKWLTEHAEKVGGYLVWEDGKVAVYRDIDVKELHEFTQLLYSGYKSTI